jgi:hypothetical protein
VSTAGQTDCFFVCDDDSLFNTWQIDFIVKACAFCPCKSISWKCMTVNYETVLWARVLNTVYTVYITRVWQLVHFLGEYCVLYNRLQPKLTKSEPKAQSRVCFWVKHLCGGQFSSVSVLVIMA